MLLIIDGSSLLSTSYYGTLPKEIKFAKSEEEKEKHYSKLMQYNGIYTNGVYSMLKTLLYIYSTLKPTYWAICFDKSRENTFRKKIYPQYKANRSETPAPLKQQFELMESVCQRLGMKVYMSDEYEADDYAGSLVSKFSDKEKCVLLTKDRDYYQLINDNTVAYMIQSSTDTLTDLCSKYNKIAVLKNTFEFDKNIVFEEEGVYPCNIIDKKAIVGDTADNIPGVKNVNKAASALINYYGNIENLYKAIESTDDKNLELQFKKLGIKRNPLNALKNDKDNCLLSKQLATIKTDIPINENLNDLFCSIDSFEFEEIKKELNFASL